ncbi:unnamed protein product [Acanthocheilonema viteae]|uniref:Uncharacterized protein n=1 Tax=Acanthocheilonema viteae TaxID=6277 RepID=A0A498SC54_ACAVI|nr:unnamed protein product [Acanthocheilonema viteae]
MRTKFAGGECSEDGCFDNVMKFADGNEKLEIHVVDDEKKDMESAADQSVNVPIIDYDHEPRSRNQSSEEMKNSLLQRPQQIFNSETVATTQDLNK